jgi:hypothetical protein
MNRRALLSMVVSMRASGPAARLSKRLRMRHHARRPNITSLTSGSAIGTCSMWAARLILLAQFVVERDGRVDAFLVDGLSQNTGQLPGLRQTVMTGDTLHLDRRHLSRRQLADVIVVDGCDHLQHDARSLLRILVVGGEVHLKLLGVWFFTWQSQPDVQGEREAAHGGLQLFAGDVLREKLQIRELLRELCRGGHSAEHDSKQRNAM